MNRRNFLQNSAIAATALAFAHKEIFAADRNKAAALPPLRRSIMLGSANVGDTIAERCRLIKAAGFDGIEPGSGMNREEVIEAAKSAGLAISSVCNSKHWDFPLSHPDAAVREKGMEAMKTAIEDAHAYGTDAVLLVPGTVNKKVAYDECWTRSTECIKKLLPTAERLKVTICIENVWNNFLLSPLEAARYVDQFKSNRVGFYFDCGNILHYGYPEQWVRILGPRIRRIHIKEFSAQIADKQGRWAGFDVQLTEGDVPWADIMHEVRKTYRGGWLTTEQGNPSSFEELTDLRERLDKIIS